jgi:hypothetical protein
MTRLPRRLVRLVCGLALLGPLAGSAAAQDMHLVVVTGVSGDEEHAASFQKWAGAVVDHAKKNGLADANIQYLAERADPAASPARQRSSRENVTAAMTAVAGRTKPGDDVVVLLIGHGSANGDDAAFNLPGPDLTATDWKGLLDRLADRRVTFINTASSSGAFVEPLKSPARTIVTATRTGGERNEPRFAEYFVESLGQEGTDRDRNGRISILEAFDYAQAKVKETYEQAGHIQTEHAVLEDGAEGKLAAAQFMAPDRSRAAIAAVTDPELRALMQQQSDLERQVAALRLKKDGMEAAEYDRQLETLLTELALKTRAVRERQAAGKPGK